jgi:hypothetical protein
MTPGPRSRPRIDLAGLDLLQGADGHARLARQHGAAPADEDARGADLAWQQHAALSSRTFQESQLPAGFMVAYGGKNAFYGGFSYGAIRRVTWLLWIK